MKINHVHRIVSEIFQMALEVEKFSIRANLIDKMVSFAVSYTPV